MTSPRAHALTAASIFAVSLLCTPPAAGQSAPRYTLRDSDLYWGSTTSRALVSGSQIPINKKYEELSASHKEWLNQLYESMGPGDEPPFPAEGLKPVYGALAYGQQKFLAKGELILIATVDPQGNVTQVKAIGSPTPDLTKFASSILLLTKFKPDRCKGEPCSMDYPFRFSFE
jgi:hypothetical protein